MPLTATIKFRRIGRHPTERLFRFGRRLNRQFWAHLLPLALMVLLAGWLTLHAADAIDRGKGARHTATSTHP